MLIWPEHSPPSSVSPFGRLFASHGPNGDLAKFLQDLGKTLLGKYTPRAILVFSAHYETSGQILGSFVP